MKRQTVFVMALLAGLFCANIGTGAALVMTVTKSRALFQEYQLLQSEEDRLQGEWSALKLEVSTRAGHSEIDEIAREVFGMIEPDENLRYIRSGP